MKLSIIICAYNEKRTILEAVRQASDVELGPDWEKEVLVVDNFSSDGTREMLQGLEMPGVRTIFHPRNLGKGASVKAIMELLLARGAKINERKDLTLETPLHVAVGAEREDLVALLVGRGANRYAKDEYGQTPVSRANSRGNLAVIKALRKPKKQE